VDYQINLQLLAVISAPMPVVNSIWWVLHWILYWL